MAVATTHLMPSTSGLTEHVTGADLVDLAIVVPDGVGLRNFVMSSFPSRFDGKVLVLQQCPEHLLGQVANSAGVKMTWHELANPLEKPIPFTMRQCISYAHMYYGDTYAMRYTRSRPVSGSWKTRLADKTGRLVGCLAAHPPGIRLLEAVHYQAVKNFPEVEEYRRLLQRTSPALLLCTNHRIPSVLPCVLAAQSLGIPTVSFIASWDNLTSKGRVAAPFDHYLVWSAHMREELLRYHAHIRPEHVHIVGTPQFDAYADEGLLWDRREFFRRVGASESRPLICYSGGDVGTCPEDQHHVRILMDLIRRGAIEGRPQVLLRPSPVDDGRRYDEIRRDFHELIYVRPQWEHPASGDWARCTPLPEDVRFLANLTYHVDMNVNLASTMTLDFSIRDKPVVNIAFDVADPPLAKILLWDHYYQWEHYQPVVGVGAARFARSAEQLASHINAYLQDPTLDTDGRRQLVELQVGVPVGRSAQAIVEALRRINNCRN